MALFGPWRDWLPAHAHAHRPEFSQSNLVSDSQPGHLNASIQDANLINPWGVAFGPTTPIWVNNNHTGTATVYNIDPTTNAITTVPLVVTIAPPVAMPGVTTASPTGIVFNSDHERLHAERQAGVVHHGHRGRHDLGLERRNVNHARSRQFGQRRPWRSQRAARRGHWRGLQRSGDRDAERRNHAAVRHEFPARHGRRLQQPMAAGEQPDRRRPARRLCAVQRAGARRPSVRELRPAG